MKKKIIAISRSNPGFGGSFQYANTILASLSKLDNEKFEIVFLYYDKSWNNIAKALPFPSHIIRWRYVKIFELIHKIAKKLQHFFTCAAIKKFVLMDCISFYVQKMKADICICLEQGYNALPESIKVVGPIHDLMHLYEPHFAEVGTSDIFNSRELTFSRHAATASAILVDSPLGKQHVIDSYHVQSDKIHVLPYIASQLFDTEPHRPDFLPQNVTSFLFYPAQFWFHKNHLALVKALAMLPESKKMHCVFVGTTDKDAYKHVQRLIIHEHLEDYIHILGYVHDTEVAWLYKNAFAMVMPTFFGPTNIPPLEALKYGCPVIVSRIYAMPWQLRDSALYIDPHNPKSIADAVVRLQEDPDLRNNLIKKGQRQRQTWTEDMFKKKFLEIILNLANE